MWFKQSTAATISIGPILDSAGAEYTSAVIGDLTITKNGTSAAMASAATLTHTSNGHYDLVMTTGNTDTLGRLQIRCNKSTYQMTQVNGMVLPAMIYDSIVAGTDRLDTNVTHWNDLATVELPLVPTTAGRKLDVSTGGEAGVDWANVGSPTTAVDLSGTTIKTTQKVDVETIKTQSVTCAAGVTVSPYVGSTGAAINGTNANTLAGHDPGETIMGATDLDVAIAAIASYIDTEVAAIKAKTDNLPAAPAATGDIPTVSQIWTTALTESYRSVGAAGTAAQLLHELIAHMGDSSISGTTKTINNRAGSAAKTYTLDSATTPTSIAEAT